MLYISSFNILAFFMDCWVSCSGEPTFVPGKQVPSRMEVAHVDVSPLACTGSCLHVRCASNYSCIVRSVVTVGLQLHRRNIIERELPIIFGRAIFSLYRGKRQCARNKSTRVVLYVLLPTKPPSTALRSSHFGPLC